MVFEFDPNKSKSNFEKHGIDFVQAQEIWEDNDVLVLESNQSDEPRFLVIGKIGTKCWSAIITKRKDAIRIISVRRSRKNEIAVYESN